MEYKTIADIYDANEKIHAKFSATLGALTEQQTAALPDGEKWSIAQIAEHVSIVGGGVYRICAKLMSKAESNGAVFDGRLDLSAFAATVAGSAETKLEAPEFVVPTGEKSIAESLKALDETQEALRGLQPLFEKYDAAAAKFPHPYFGDMTAVEWLVLYGGHEGRHLKQIGKILEKLSERN